MQITIVNASDRSWTRHNFVLAFGAYGDTVLRVYANSLDSALDEAIDWIVDNAPGLLADEQVAETFQDAIARGMSEEDAQEEATQDTTCGGNCGNYILSQEWAIVAEDPSRTEIKALLAR